MPTLHLNKCWVVNGNKDNQQFYNITYRHLLIEIKNRKYMNKISVTLTVITCIAIIFAGCKKQQTETTNTEAKPEIVETQVLHKTQIARDLKLTTTLEGYETMNIAPSLTGKIEHIYVEVGDKVSTGSNLVRMDQQQYQTASLVFNNAKVELDRVEELKKAGNISTQVYDQTKLQYDQAKRNIDFLNTNTYVKAQFPGVISSKNYEDGELYSGQPILVLTQINILKAFINIPESYYTLVKTGMKVVVTSEIYPNTEFNATIETIYPTIDPNTHTFKVRLKVPNGNERLRPGMYANTSLALGEIKTTIVPYQAVLKLQGANDRYVFINRNGIAKRITVQLGERFDDKIEIISNEIQEGDELVVVGQARLIDGVKLDVKNKLQ